LAYSIYTHYFEYYSALTIDIWTKQTAEDLQQIF